jgi:hypothetical protein
MLALDGVVFFHNHFIRHGPRIFLGHIKVPSACRRVQTDLDRRRFGHRNSPRAQDTCLGEILETCLLRITRAESTVKRRDCCNQWASGGGIFANVKIRAFILAKIPPAERPIAGQINS